jgi:D-glycero-alpha-D-manno-heptose-7-phosphate kinase
MNIIKKVHARAPLRLGLAGGGTDVSPYCDIHGGAILNVTISLYTHCQLAIFDHAGPSRFYAADFNVEENSDTVNAERRLVLHHAVYDRINRQYLNGEAPAVELITYSDAPPGSGVGSSSTLVVAMVAAYAHAFDIPLGEYDIAHLAYEIERIDCGMAGGKQDQYSAAFGGVNYMEFGADDHVIVNPLRIDFMTLRRLESQLLLFYTGRSRESARIIESQIRATESKAESALNAMHNVKKSAVEMKNALLKNNLDSVISVLGSSWLEKKKMAPGISNSAIDAIAEMAYGAGATGLKVSGAGGGGFMVIAVPPTSRWAVRRALADCGGQFYEFEFEKHGVSVWNM